MKNTDDTLTKRWSRAFTEKNMCMTVGFLLKVFVNLFHNSNRLGQIACPVCHQSCEFVIAARPSQCVMGIGIRLLMI